MMIRGFLPAIVIASAAVMNFNSGSTIVNAITVGTSTATTTTIDVPATATTSRNLFELPLPFDSVNNECKRACDIISQEGEVVENDIDNDFLINACPKCPEKYSPCNYCCFDGASSLKLRFFGCPGTIEIVNNVSEQILNEKNCDDIYTDTDIDNINSSGVYFVDCDCYDNAITITSSSSSSSSSSSYGDISSCPLYDIESLTYNTPDITISYFEICLVSANRRPGEGPVADFSIPLPSVIGLEHIPYDDLAFGEDDDSAKLISTAMSITFFDTTCNEQVIGNHGSEAYPLGPGYGKFSGTCPNEGFIDFEQDDTPRLPDALDFYNGKPPSTSFFFEMVDGTSVGFWNDDDDTVFFESTFATCKCRDCSEFTPTFSPSVSPTLETSASPSAKAPSSVSSTDGPIVYPVLSMPTPNPVGGSGAGPSFGTIQPTATATATAGPNELPTPEPSFIPSTGPNIDMSNSPSTTTPRSIGSPSPEQPTCSPNDEIISVGPVMVPVSVTAFPTSTVSPTDPSSTMLTTEDTLLSTTDGGDADDCADCSECFSFAIENCVNSDLTSICLPQLSNDSRRFLNEQSEYHRDFLIEEIEKHKIALDEALYELEKII